MPPIQENREDASEQKAIQENIWRITAGSEGFGKALNMSIKTKQLFDRITYRLFYLITISPFVYISIASTVFAFRHPWMTTTENFLNFHRALMFEKVEYSEIRGQYK